MEFHLGMSETIWVKSIIRKKKDDIGHSLIVDPIGSFFERFCRRWCCVDYILQSESMIIYYIFLDRQNDKVILNLYT